MNKRVFSGVQPTGNLHLGNYLGAIKNWTQLDAEFERLFCIVDLHAITLPQDPQELLNNTRATAAVYLACGIDPSSAYIFHQSSVAEHSELAWLFSSITPLGWLNRMTQFKEKSGKHKDKSCLGLYSYPVLMAADILLYNATHVPVGEDQKQHLELTRDIAASFNHQYGCDHFTLPEPMIMGGATRVMSLRDGTKKMSKSDISEYSRINLTDSADEIRQKIKKAKSDATPGMTYDVENRPESSNLLCIYAALSNQSVEESAADFANTGFAEFKNILTDKMIETITPIGDKIKEYLKDTSYLDGILHQGSAHAREIAHQNLKEVKHIMGFLET